MTTLVGRKVGGDVEGFEGTAIICGFVFRAKVGGDVIGSGVGGNVG